MNALEMKLIAMKFALARRQVGLPTDQRFQTNSGAADVEAISTHLSQGIVIDDRDLTITNTIVDDCEHQANAEPVTTTTTTTTTSTTNTTTTTTQAPSPEPEPVIEPQIIDLKPQPTTTAAPSGFGGRIWEYFRDTGNGQPKP
jgi:hypothetical protein